MIREGRRWLAAAAAVVGVLVPGRVGADEGDYVPSNEAWNGLSTFVRLAEEETDGVERPERLDYDQLEADDTLIVVYPTEELDVESLASFVIDGGRVILADDFGRSGSFLERLDIRRDAPRAEDLPHGNFAGDNQMLPVFRPRGVHPLLEEVEQVVANHPAVLRHRGGPVVPYDDEGGLVFDMNLGEGKVIVLGDASLLINHMLGIADNRRLAVNSVRYLCDPRETCRPSLFPRTLAQTGSYASGDDSSESPYGWVADRVNEAVSEAQENFPSSPLLYYLTLVLTGGLLLYLGAVFSIRSSRRYSEFVDESLDQAPEPQSEFEWNVDRYGAAARETNFALPLSILKETFEELFLREFDLWEVPKEERPDVGTLASRFSERYLQDRTDSERRRIENEVRDLLAKYARIPTRHRVYLDSDTYFSDGDLIQVYRRTMRVLELMGLEEEYERRTRPFV